MIDRIDALLNRLKATVPDRDLNRVESAVWSRIESEKRGDLFGGKTLQIQIFVTCGALLVGLVIAQFVGEMPMPVPLNSEIVVLSDDGAVAPSVLLEGGI
jgi:hypothetical protein